MGLDVLAAVEHDFECASFCKTPPSQYFTFSTVGNGKPERNCTSAVNHFMEHAAKYTATWFWIFFAITFICFIYVTAFACRKHNDMESPLLGHHHHHH